MASFFVFVFLLLFFSLSMLQSCCHGATGNFRFDLHHRFSDPVKRWAAERSGAGLRPEEWPEKGTVDYYAALVDHDRVLRGRGLAEEVDQTLAFSEGNVTFRLSTLGFLHYATVSLGTPSKDFLVALDTGSDLFWVPCDCQSCAPTASANYGFTNNFDFSIYSPNTSSTSKNVPCTSNLCAAQNECTGGANICPYRVDYVSNNTSSSGVLVEDVMYLTTEDGQHEVDAQITFGCGQVQSGSFLDAAAPNGLFGLGMDNISVPSILSAAGLTTNSFSMCFGSDGVGRIIFGDKGSSDQDETPFNLRKLHPSYNISVTGFLVGPKLTDTSFSALFDSGTSFTYLADPAYTQLSESFNSQIQDKRYSNSSKLPFEYCYLLSSNDTSSLIIPSINLTMKGGGQFSVLDPLIFITSQEETVYCLAVLKSNNLIIIGQNFMTGQRIVFDREKLVLGWKKFNCYDIENSSTLPINPRNTTAMPPSVAGVPSSYNPEATVQTRNESQGTVLPVPPVISHSSHSCSCFIYTHLVLLILFLAIL
ncbi:aspartyl protease family protein 1-like protein [Cinnamomum micranthum f. kanehirae]|uniref:Aspartyl protease family protein 1-like protein n=1 Tax=Cinnamomum micranthum f. kanehirae TaxID=337451 RepID=A0A443PIV8_9MAGN|nr:aspartyl protease family protein 1-like protein [Cinnamomum micranthum f. kanehirae]